MTMTSSRPQQSYLIAGVLISIFMMIPSLNNVEGIVFSVIFHAMMFVVLVAPFVILFRRSHHGEVSLFLPISFLVGHLYFLYNIYTSSPQEFGYVGLIFVPLLESVILLPLNMIVKRVVK